MESRPLAPYKYPSLRQGLVEKIEAHQPRSEPVMQIIHPDVIECRGYGYGAITQIDWSYRNPSTGNLYVGSGDRVFDVHPFRDDVKGYPIRWELDAYQKQKLQETRI
jgi:hypothetical protein